MIRIPIAKIRRDGGTQPRETLDAAVIAEYAEAMRGGTEFPPVVVFYDGTAYWLADGFHRVAAAETLGRPNDTIPAEVRQGTQREAILCSTGVNDAHGLRRNDADKRRAVQTLLADPEWGRWSNREIARQAKVSESLVRSMRELSAFQTQIDASPESPTPLPPTSTERTVTRAGTTYTMQTGGIGQAPNYATVAELQPAVVAWVQALSADATAQRHILAQIGLQNQVGMDHIERLYQFSGTPKPCRRADLKSAAAAVLRGWGRSQESGVRGQESGVRGPESGVRGQESGDGSPEGQGATGAQPGDPDRNGHTAEWREREALRLQPLVVKWLKLPSAASAEELRVALKLAASVLDLEGWHARRGRNFDWEALVGVIGNGVDHGALRLAVRAVWEDLGKRLAAMDDVDDVDDVDAVAPSFPRWLGPALRRVADGGRGQEAGGRSQEAGGRRQEAGGRRQEAGGRRQESGPSTGSGNGPGGNGAARRPAALRQAQGALDWLAQAKHVVGLKNTALDKASAFIGQYGPSWAESEDVAQLLAELALARATGVTAASWAANPVA